MRRFVTAVLTMALFIILAAEPTDAQRPDEPGLQSVDDGSNHPDPLDPADGTILATLASTPNGPEGAEGRLVVTYLGTQDVARVQIRVSGLEPGPTYEVLMIHNRPVDSEVFSLAKLRVDEDGNGRANVVWYDPFPFNAVNVRLDGQRRSAVLSTIGRVGGLQQQVPSRRGKGGGR